MSEQPKRPQAFPQRYDLVPNYRCGGVIDEMERADDGDWVRWEDVEAALTAAREDICAERDALRHDFEQAVSREINYQRERDEIRRQRDALAARVAVLTAALQPFADMVHSDGVEAPYPEERWTPLLDAAKHALLR